MAYLSLTPSFNVPWSCCALQVLAKMKGRDLAGRTYQPLFPYFLRLKQPDGAMKGAFRVLTDEYVTADAGTGVVHQAPAFGEDDYRVCRHHGEPLQQLDSSRVACMCLAGCCKSGCQHTARLLVGALQAAKLLLAARAQVCS